MRSYSVGGRGRTWLALGLGLGVVLAVVGALAGLKTMAASASPEKLSNDELLSRVARAPETAPDFSATVTVEQSLIPAQILEAAGQDSGFAASGPQTARVWYGGKDKLRAELQGDNGDRIFVQNGERAWAYDGTTNTLKTGERPPEPSSSDPPDTKNPPTPVEIDRMLAKLAPTSKLTQGPPVRFAGREAYVMTLRPKDESTTLVDHGRVLVDSETFLPLELALYAQGKPDPVFSWRVSGLNVGNVPAERFQFQAPSGASVIPFDDGRKAQRKPEMRTEPKEVETVARAQSLVNFQIRELAKPPGGRALTGVYLKGTDGVVLTYGSGWGTVVLAQGPQQAGASVPRQGTTGNNTALPTVDLGGVEATELSTPVGTGLRWNEGGVSYALAGSVPAPELERAARELR